MTSPFDDTRPLFGSDADMGGQSIWKMKNPIVIITYLTSRWAAIFFYLFAGVMLSFVSHFILLIFLFSIDFWITKNVAGRRLVGLRWWNVVKDDGESDWVFESLTSAEALRQICPTERLIFWSSLVLSPLFWALYFITCLMYLRFQWLVIVSIGLTLNMLNLIGYMRCAFGHKLFDSPREVIMSKSPAAGFVAQGLKSLFVRSSVVAASSQPAV